MFGPFAFLAGLAMLGGAGVSKIFKCEETVAYEKGRFQNGHPIQSRCTTSEGQKLGMSNDRHINYPLTEYYGGFDYPRLVAELGTVQANMVLEQWALCEMGFDPSFGTGLVEKYCWSTEYMSPYLPYAKWLHEHPEMLGNLKENYRNKINFNIKKDAFYEQTKKDHEYIPYLNWQNFIKENVWPVYLGYYKNYTQWFEQIAWNVPHRFLSINDQHTNSDNIFAEVSPKPLTIEMFDEQHHIEYSDYVDYLEKNIYINDSYNFFQERSKYGLSPIVWQITLDAKKAREVLSKNQYIKMCKNHKEKARILKNQWYVKMNQLDEHDICEITKGCDTGVHYTSLRYVGHDEELIEQRGYNIKQIIEYKKPFIYYCPYTTKHQQRTTGIAELHQMFEKNYREIEELFKTDDEFAIDFMVCWLLEHCYYTKISDMFLPNCTQCNKEVLKRANKIVNSIIRRENKNPRKNKQEENAD